MNSRTLWLVAGALGLLVLVLFLNNQFPGALSDPNNKADLFYRVLLLVLVASSLIVSFRGNLSQAAKYGAIWVAIILLLVLGYSMKDGFSGARREFTGNLIPSKAIELGTGEVSIRRNTSGHFVVDGIVNGVKVRFLVDTGASDIALTAADAERAGFDVASLKFNKPYQTANGMTFGASVRLDKVQVGDIAFQDLRGSVLQDRNGVSLLGMTFLNQLESYEVRRDELILRR